MGAKYTATSVSGYNASPPSDDGTVSEANKVKWSTIKTKLPDPIKTALESIDTKLTTWAAYGPTAITEATTIGADDNEKFSEVATACTLTIGDAATLAAGWMHYVINSSSGTVLIKRTTGGDTIDGIVADLNISAGNTIALVVNAAANGFRTFGASGPQIKVGSFTRDLTAVSGNQAITGVGFKPRTLIFVGAVNAAFAPAVSVTTSSVSGGMFGGSDTSTFFTSSNVLYFGNFAGTTGQLATLSSFDDNGFTLSWTKNGSPAGTATIYYLAIR